MAVYRPAATYSAISRRILASIQLGCTQLGSYRLRRNRDHHRYLFSRYRWSDQCLRFRRIPRNLVHVCGRRGELSPLDGSTNKRVKIWTQMRPGGLIISHTAAAPNCPLLGFAPCSLWLYASSFRSPFLYVCLLSAYTSVYIGLPVNQLNSIDQLNFEWVSSGVF